MRGAVLISPSLYRWHCPNCTRGATTRQLKTPFHPCAGLRGLAAPFIREGVKAKVEAMEREDYVGSETVTTDDSGRAVQSVVTTRDDGQDCAVFVPCATMRLA